MKILIASDLHGSLYYIKKLVDIINETQIEKVILLGDILYHGPRNSINYEYDTKKAYELLNTVSDKIIAVRGNCDSEVDDMVLNFSLVSDYKKIIVDNKSWYLTHGHINNKLPKMENGSILFNGHTHVYSLSDNFINPGSISLPRNNGEHTYIIYEDNTFNVYDLDTNEIIDILKIKE